MISPETYMLVQVENLHLSSDWICGMLGRPGFALRELTAYGVIELLATVSNPLPVAKVLLRIVGQAVEHIMPSLHFALVVPLHEGGRWGSDAKLYDAYANGKRELVILDRLEARLARMGAGDSDVLVCGRLMPSAEVLQRFELWLSPAGQTEIHHVTVLCQPSERLDLQLASALAGRLADTVVGQLGIRVVFNDEQVCVRVFVRCMICQ